MAEARRPLPVLVLMARASLPLSRAHGDRDCNHLQRAALRPLTATVNIFQGLCRHSLRSVPELPGLTGMGRGRHQAGTRDVACHGILASAGCHHSGCLGLPSPCREPSTTAWVQGLSPAQGEKGAAALLQPPKEPLGAFPLIFCKLPVTDEVNHPPPPSLVPAQHHLSPPTAVTMLLTTPHMPYFTSQGLVSQLQYVLPNPFPCRPQPPAPPSPTGSSVSCSDLPRAAAPGGAHLPSTSLASGARGPVSTETAKSGLSSGIIRG